MGQTAQTPGQSFVHPKFGHSIRSRGTFTAKHCGVLQPAYLLWRESLKKLEGMPPCDLLLPLQSRFVPQGTCGTQGSVEAVYPLFTIQLKNQIELRGLEAERYSQQQLLFIGWKLLLLCSEFQQREQRLPTIGVDNVFLNNLGQLKVICLQTSPNQTSNFFKAVEGSSEVLLSPEDLQDLKARRFLPTSKPGESEVFCSGLLLLQAATLQKSSSLINFSHFQLKRGQLHERMQLLSSRCSEFMCALISAMLALEDRPTAAQLVFVLEPYSQKLLSVQEAAFDPQVSLENLRKRRGESQMNRNLDRLLSSMGAPRREAGRPTVARTYNYRKEYRPEVFRKEY